MADDSYAGLAKIAEAIGKTRWPELVVKFAGIFIAVWGISVANNFEQPAKDHAKATKDNAAAWSKLADELAKRPAALDAPRQALASNCTIRCEVEEEARPGEEAAPPEDKPEKKKHPEE